MKKKTICLVLAAALLIVIPLSASADTTGVCFTGVGDGILDLNSMAVYSGGTLCVPARAFSSFGVNLNYFSSESIALLYTSTKQIFFNLTDGGSYDSLDTTYEASAMLRNGIVYVPVAWTCSYFGLSYSYISGTGNGDVVRIKNGSEVLTDKQYLDSTNSSMRIYYNEYFGTVTPSSPTPSVSVSPGEEVDHSGTYVFLSFIGLPDTKLLDTLSRFAYPAVFFVTEEQASSAPDLLRRIYGSGHNIGIYCAASTEEISGAAQAVFGVCQAMPMFITSDSSIAESCRAYAAENAMTYFSPSLTADGNTDSRNAIAASLEALSSAYVGISVTLSETTEKMLPSFLSYISINGYSVTSLKETFY